MAAVGRYHKRGAAAFGRGTSSVVSFVVAMNRVDVVDLVVGLVDVGLVDVVPAVFSFFGPRLYFWFLPPAVFLAFAPRLFFGLLAPGCIGQGQPPAVFRAVW